MQVELCIGALLMVGTGQAHASPCDSTGELNPPLRADEIWHATFSPASGYERTTLFQVPASAPSGDRTLIVLLHGGGQHDREDLLSDMRSYGWMEIAENHGIVLAYPTAMNDPLDPDTRFNWNDGRLGTDYWAMPDHADIDDVGYLVEIVDYARQVLDVGSRTFVMGVSNGGMMALRLVSDSRMQGRVQRITVLDAQIPVDRFAEPVAPVPLLMISGAADPLMPFQGGDIWLQPELLDGSPLRDPIYASSVVSWAETIGRFLAVHGCSGLPVIRNFPDVDGDGIFVREFNFCPSSGNVRAYVVAGGGHRWHGIGDNSYDWLRECRTVDLDPVTFNYYMTVGPTTQDGFSATRAAWRFFRQPALLLSDGVH